MLARIHLVSLLLSGTLIWGCDSTPATLVLPPTPTGDLRPAARTHVEEVFARFDAEPSADNFAEAARTLHAYALDAAAEQAYRSVRSHRPDSGELAYLHGHVLNRLGRRGDALRAWKEATADTSIAPRAWARIIEAQLEQGQTRHAGKSLRKALRTAPADIELRFLQGRILHETGDFGLALDIYRRILEAGVDDPLVHYQAAQSARALGDMASAEQHLEKFSGAQTGAKRRWPDPVLRAVERRARTAKATIARVQYQLARGGSIPEAISELEQALQADSEAHEVHVSLVGLYGAVRNFRMAEKHLLAALAHLPDSAQLHYNIGTVRFEQGKLHDSAEAFLRAIKLSPGNARAMAMLARTLLRQGQPDEAGQWFAQAAELAPADPTVWQFYAPYLIEQRRFEEAHQLLLGQGPTIRHDALRQYFRGQAFRRSGATGLAADALRDARTLADRAGDAQLAAAIRVEQGQL